jgi:hypothetical protein
MGFAYAAKAISIGRLRLLCCHEKLIPYGLFTSHLLQQRAAPSTGVTMPATSAPTKVATIGFGFHCQMTANTISNWKMRSKQGAGGLIGNRRPAGAADQPKFN